LLLAETDTYPIARLSITRGTARTSPSWCRSPRRSRGSRRQRHRFEAHDLIIRAWTEPGPFAFDGDHFSLRYVNLWPRPYQTPHPPVWIPSQGSSETVAWAANPKRKYPFLVTFSSADLVARYQHGYREQARQYGYEAGADQLGWACPIYVLQNAPR
jgi:alkanesulfonate monooxygenase SsuD/methylene tetrahydromethanopterin reductase-like flavin-dependent oxidoreductase (luciferase family)